MDRNTKQIRARRVFSGLRRHLALTDEQVGKMFGADAPTVAAWENGLSEVPELALARLISAQAALSCLLEIFLPERLPHVIRREAAAFDGRRALDWILDGRIAEVARRYEEGLSYQLPKTA